MDRDKILKMLNDGKSYQDISKEMKISKWTLLYHFSPNRKSSVKASCEKYSKKTPIISKMDAFFRGNSRLKTKPIVKRFSIEELKNKIGPNPCCYLTGVPIDITKPETYSLDHIIPVSKGGESSLENCGLIDIKVNYCKSNLSVKEFKDICESVFRFSQK